MGGKFKFSAQESVLEPFVGNGAKVKIPCDIKPPLATYLLIQPKSPFKIWVLGCAQRYTYRMLSAPNNANETYTLKCLGRAAVLGSAKTALKFT